MDKKIFNNARFCPKGDIEANWNKAIGFVPLDKEIIIYKADETHSAARFKVGDGKTGINDLPFSGTDVEAIEKLINEKGELLIEYVDNAVAALPQADWNQNDETAKNYIKNRPFYAYSRTIDESECPQLDHLYGNYLDEDGVQIDARHWKILPFDGEKELNVIVASIRELSVVVNPSTGTNQVIDTMITMTGSEMVKRGFIKLVTKESSKQKIWVCKYFNTKTNIVGSKEYQVSSLTIEDIQQIDKKFIPKVNILQGDWQQNNQTSQDYIKNRPFYDEYEQFKVLYKCEFDGIIEGKNNITIQNDYFVEIGYYEPKTEGCYLEITGTANESPVDDVLMPIEGGFISYTGVVVVVTNRQLFEASTGILAPSTGVYVLYTDNNSYVSKVLFKEVQIVALKPIDEKFIPDSIARVEQVPEVDQIYNAESENAQSGKAVAEAILPIIKINNEQDDKIAELEGKVTTLIFNISKWTRIQIRHVEGITKIDWGDGTINNELSHMYQEIGEYVCKIYDATSIGVQAFSDCTNLVSAVISNRVTDIGDIAFYYCSNLKSIVIPDGVTSIGQDAFNHCTSLTEIVIPDSVTSIGGSAFSSCTSLTNITIPNSVTSIGDGVFDDCDGLTEIVIGDSVMSLGVRAFVRCDNIARIIFKNQTPITYNNFAIGPSLTHIYVPYGTSKAYKTKWATDGATQDILDKIVESDREAYMSDIDEKIAAIDFPEVDQAYSAESANAQSGIAIDSVLKPIEQKNNEQDTKIAVIESKVITATKDSILSIFN